MNVRADISVPQFIDEVNQIIYFPYFNHHKCNKLKIYPLPRKNLSERNDRKTNHWVKKIFFSKMFSKLAWNIFKTEEIF